MNLSKLSIYLIIFGVCLGGILLGYIIADGLYHLFSSVTINFIVTQLLGVLGLIGFIFIIIGLCLWLWKVKKDA